MCIVDAYRIDAEALSRAHQTARIIEATAKAHIDITQRLNLPPLVIQCIAMNCRGCTTHNIATLGIGNSRTVDNQCGTASEIARLVVKVACV